MRKKTFYPSFAFKRHFIWTRVPFSSCVSLSLVSLFFFSLVGCVSDAYVFVPKNEKKKNCVYKYMCIWMRAFVSSTGRSAFSPSDILNEISRSEGLSSQKNVHIFPLNDNHVWFYRLQSLDERKSFLLCKVSHPVHTHANPQNSM